ncbi:MAG: hypothetical protein JW969_08425 [Spirochaetales bacterium]|nr:hypothetical protein [Spirochaetales bacterium]
MYLWIITGVVLIVSFIFNKDKTIQGLKKAWKQLYGIGSLLVLVLICVAIALNFINEDLITQTLSGGNRYIGFLSAVVIGSIAMMPGFIAFPLAGILRQNNVPFMVVSAFTTTLMMVGILTFPFEKKYLGFKVALIRNFICFTICIVVALVTGLIYREIF